PAPSISREERRKLAAERKNTFRQQLVDKIVERLGGNRQNQTAQPAPPAPTPEKKEVNTEKPVEQKPERKETPKAKEEKAQISTPEKDIPVQKPTDEDVQIGIFDNVSAWDQGPKTLLDELKDVDTRLDFYEEDETDQQARYRGKWVIFRVITEDKTPTDEELYFFELHASNGEKLLSSEEYTTYAGALRGIETHKANILRGNFKIALSKKGDYIFKLLSGKNLLLCIGENYATKARCESAIRSVKRFAKTAIVDENLEDHIVKIPMEDSEPLPPAEGYEGKWIISGTKDENGEMMYFFELYASNGEKLLSSEEYTTYIGAVNGIQTHKTNIEQGNFRVSLTKRGDYIYKLLNKNGQLLCLGEHYKTKQRCLNAVESVKRFSKNSPVLTDPKLVENTDEE
ncbi:MAG: DUF1508 domain-containing protein, partial [Clostridia bacterium]|nr:DUF1508 domain-containing protein [Clostridia bacterium]